VVRLEGLNKLKKRSTTLSGLQPVTFRLVAKRLNRSKSSEMKEEFAVPALYLL
jgi:hypothetical protein